MNKLNHMDAEHADERYELDDVIFSYDEDEDEQQKAGTPPLSSWKILVVDDEPAVHEATELALEDVKFEGKPITFISASSGAEAKALLESNPDAAVILLDVVMERNDSGLDIAKFVRETMHNKLTRIVLRTGQPGQAPERSVILAYDINDYKLKAELTQDKLITTTIMALRGYQDLVAIEAAKMEIQSINSQLRQEIQERERVEEELRQHRDRLEHLVEERTAELKTAKEKAELANQAKSIFLANMSHELRSPLNAILGFAQLMNQSSTLPQEQRENVNIITRSGEHLLSLINDVLDISKIEAGRATLHETDFDLYHLLGGLEDMFRLRTREQQVRLLFEHRPKIPRYIRTDEAKLRQVLINLLSNAMKFTQKGEVIVRISDCELGIADWEERQSKIRNLKFEIEDTGPGIAPEEMANLFEAFTQTRTGRQSQRGTGLGLPISKKFVELMGGEMYVSSEVGQGSVFSFDIQVAVRETSDIQNNVPSRKVIALEPEHPCYRILIVDDRQENRQLLTKLLAPIGFDLQEAGNGREAIDIWTDWKPHLIWMDNRMPDMDGYEATKIIRNEELRIKHETQTAIIAITTSVFEEEQAMIRSTGYDDFLRKPFRPEDILEMMHKHLGVRYVYEEEQKAEGCDSPPGRGWVKAEGKEMSMTEALSMLPNDLLDELEQASIQGDLDEIERLLENIRTHNIEVADALKQLVDEFEFGKILACIRNKNQYGVS